MLITTLALLGALAAARPARPAEPPALVPRPRSLTLHPGAFPLRDGVAIVATSDRPEARETAEFLRDALAPIRTSTDARSRSPRITLAIDSSGPPESYRLEVSPDSITVRGADADGLFWGVQTLRQLLPPEFESLNQRRGRTWEIPALVIDDRPSYHWRGALIDVARHFLTVPEMERQIALLARYKINVLHWHLADDQGWRVEIPKYPLLTKVGAWRTEADGTRYGGFYTQPEIREVAEFARRHHVMVVPEIDLPGHSSAAIAAYPWLGCTGISTGVPTTWGVFDDILCVGDQKVLDFVSDLLDQVVPLFPSPYFHVGGDEVPTIRWKTSPAVQQRMKDEHLTDEEALQGWFTGWLAGQLTRRRRTLIGWDEILDGGAPPTAVIQAWRGDERTRLAARAGHPVIASPGDVYLDRQADLLPLETVYRYQPAPDSLAPADSARVLGGEAAFWSEHITAVNLDPMMFPRVLAFAEAVWSGPGGGYPNFVARLDRDQDARLAAMGVTAGSRDRAIVMFTAKYDSTTRQVGVEAAPGFSGVTIRTTPSPLPDSGQVTVAAYLNGKPLPYERTYALMPNLAWGRPVALAKHSSARYPGTGPHTLTDHALGSTDLHDGFWQGWLGSDLDATVDLGREVDVREVTGSFLQDLQSWIVEPRQLTVWLSLDALNWSLVGSVLPDSLVDPRQAQRRSLTVRLAAPHPARWVRVVARSSGPLPLGHPGAGQPSWIFADEILVR